MDISPYLAALMNQKDQVIVPGLGKFYQTRVAGYYQEETKTFYPPSKKIEFTTEYRHDDKLVQFISRQNDTSLTAAYALLDEYVKDLKTILKTDAVKINGIGKLMSLDGKITLEPEINPTNNEDFFGLPPIAVTQQTANNKIDLLQNNENPTPKVAEEYSLAQQALDTAMPDDYEDEKQKNVTLKIIIIFVISAIIGSLIALYYLEPATFNKLIKINQTVVTSTITNNNLPDIQAIKKADSVYDSNDIEAKLKAKGFDIEKVRDSTDVSIDKKAIPNKNDIRYEIIIGLYLKRADAVKRVAQLKANGINAYIVDDADGPMTKISGATLYNEAEAKQELKRIREQLNPEAFIKPIKPLK